MECIEARALKSSFLSTQMALKANSEVFYNDDVWCLTRINSVASDDFPVEELLNLDFSDKELQDGSFFQEDEEASDKGVSHISSSSSSFSGADELDSLSVGELSVPMEDLENLEWLSQFVNDSASELSLLYPSGGFTAKPAVKSVEAVKTPPPFPSNIPSKARSKRSWRPNTKPLFLASPPRSAGDSFSTPSSSSSHGSSTVPPSFVLMFTGVEKPPPAKRQKRKPEADAAAISGRRCTHCQVQKTPQWRTGPLGPKTLCNACGVRFKSGRLFPEYRPACSPTFSQEIHSNSHRKVLEMRRRREETVPADEPGLAPAVQIESA
ncbi:GATA transcription factor 5-like [Andrographis paniculata]|uniref:GATA transcription factor 5-like n=1 Tax=Andrographis paniculata TaxID=175694 RepID=UPI0021E7B613|nr:GATA transcription factor 5-like [Andrographis paniculata]XP_051146405.1 GATA transcription factor 5-like [Andrographis paniculata]